METKQIKILDSYFIATNNLLQLGSQEKDYMIKIVNNSEGIVCGVLEGGEVVSCLVASFRDNSIRVLHTGGKFLKHINYLDTFIEALAKFYDKQKVIVDSARKTARKKLLLLGYKETEKNYFIKEV